MGDGTLGWREYGPYDAIVVSAGAPHVPPAFEEQLGEGGRLLIPLQRGGEPDEIVGAALYFATDASSFTTGALLTVAGGSGI